MRSDRYLKAVLMVIAIEREPLAFTPLNVENVGDTPAQRPGE